MKRFIKILKVFSLVLLAGISAMAQYVHPNQAGRRGGDTGSGKGQQVVTSTYLGTIGLTGQGVIMSVNKDGSNASSFYAFQGFPSDGSYPYYTTPHQGSDGILYGTTFIGGTSNWGTAYSFNLTNATKTTIFNSAPGTGSAGNYANINELSDGKLYVVQSVAGASGYGVLLRMDKNGSNQQTLHLFLGLGGTANYSTAADAQLTSPKYDGAYPYGYVVEGPDGKIYGASYAGGGYNRGTTFRCNKDGSNYEIINIGNPTLKAYVNGRLGVIPLSYNIMNPRGNVAITQQGQVILTGYYGGATDIGGIARFNLDGSDYRILYTGSAPSGYYPVRGALVIDDKIYGTMEYGGGTTNTNGVSFGVVYRMNTDGTDYEKIVTFDHNGSGVYADGSNPWAGVSYDGNFLYGTTFINGGAGIGGTIYKVKPDGSDFKTIHRFSNTAGATCGTGTQGLFTYYPSAERVTFADVDISLSKTCITALNCSAGTATPVISGGNSISNNCPAITADLTTITATNTPANTIIKWHTATPATAANAVANPAAVVAGTYYAVFFDVQNGCYGGATSGSATTSVTVTITSPCCPAGKNAPPLSSSTIQNVCPTTTVNLTTLAYGPAPSGSPLSWHTGTPATAANQIKAGNPLTSATAVPAGTYYAAYNSGGTCFSPVSTAVTASVISCADVTVFNTCPATTISLNGAIVATPPSGTVISWHTATPATTVNKVANPASVSPGTYYAAFYDATNNCFSNTGASYKAVVKSCTGPVLTPPVAQNATKSEAKTGNAVTELAPTGGTGPYTYSNGSTDPACVGVSGAQALPASSNLLVNSNGTYSYTAPTNSGTYYFCVKVCDNDPVSPQCTVATYQVVVASPTGAGTVDCSKTQIISAPVAGQSGQYVLVVSVNVTTAGCFPLIISGSGISPANGVSEVCTTTTGIQNFTIPVYYNGTALSSLNFTIGASGSCTADMTKPAKVVSKNVYSLDGCTAIVPGVLTK